MINWKSNMIVAGIVVTFFAALYFFSPSAFRYIGVMALLAVAIGVPIQLIKGVLSLLRTCPKCGASGFIETKEERHIRGWRSISSDGSVNSGLVNIYKDTCTRCGCEVSVRDEDGRYPYRLDSRSGINVNWGCLISIAFALFLFGLIWVTVRLHDLKLHVGLPPQPVPITRGTAGAHAVRGTKRAPTEANPCGAGQQPCISVPPQQEREGVPGTSAQGRSAQKFRTSCRGNGSLRFREIIIGCGFNGTMLNAGSRVS